MSGRHRCHIISPGKFTKSRQCSSPHPNHVLFILAKVRKVLFSITIWIFFTPIRRWHDFPWFVFWSLYNFLVTFPSNTFVCHWVCRVSIHTPNLHRAVDRIIKQWISNQPTRIICLLGLLINRERLACACFDGFVINSLPFHLLEIKGLYVSPVILIEVG